MLVIKEIMGDMPRMYSNMTRLRIEAESVPERMKPYGPQPESVLWTEEDGRAAAHELLEPGRACR